MIRARSVAPVLLGVVVATAAPATAAAESAAPAPVAVVATIRGDAKADTRCLESAVTGFLAGKGITVTWSKAHAPSSGPTGGLDRTRFVAVDVDLSEPARVALTFTHGTAGLPVARQVTTTRGLDDVACEAVADVIESSVLAIAAGAVAQPPSAPRPAADPPADVARAPAAPAAVPAARYTAALAYVAEPVAWGILQSGVELGFGFRPPTPHQRSWMHLAYYFPLTVAADLAAVRWQTLSVAPLSRAWATSARRTWMEVRVWWAADFTYVERIPLPGQPDTSSGAKWVAGAHFGWDITGLVRFAAQNALFASLRLGYSGAFWSLDGNYETLFQPLWGIRPTLMVGVRWL